MQYQTDVGVELPNATGKRTIRISSCIDLIRKFFTTCSKRGGEFVKKEMSVSDFGIYRQAI